MKKINAISKLVIGAMLLFVKPINWIDAELAMRTNTLPLHNADIKDGVVEIYNETYVLYTTTPMFQYIGIALIVWGLIQIGVEVYGHFKPTES